MNKNYLIKNEKFEGPLDVLLDMIERRKLLINDFSLSAIADDFIQYMNEVGEKSVAKISDFLVIASTLILIKSRSLLPNLKLEEGEESDIQNLEVRLNILKIIKDKTLEIIDLFQRNILFKKIVVKTFKPKFSPSSELNSHNMRIIILDVINTFPKFEDKKEVRIRKTITLEEMMNRLINRVKKSVSISFSEISGKKNKAEKVDVIISFLAMLELVKRGFLFAKQNDKFEDINLESIEVDTPAFGI